PGVASALGDVKLSVMPRQPAVPDQPLMGAKHLQLLTNWAKRLDRLRYEFRERAGGRGPRGVHDLPARPTLLSASARRRSSPYLAGVSRARSTSRRFTPRPLSVSQRMAGQGMMGSCSTFLSPPGSRPRPS